METDELEFLISRHFDGTLADDEAARLQERLTADAGARSLFDSHAKLDAALRASKSEIVIEETWLSGQIADAIDAANAKPIRHLSWSWAAPMVAAACLLIGLTLGVIFLRDNDEKIAKTTPPPTKVDPVVQVALGSPAAPETAQGFATVSVGIPANLTPQIVAALYLSQDVNASRVSIRAAGRRSSDAFD